MALSAEEFAALGEIARARRQLLISMFAGTQLRFGTMGTLKTGKSLLSNGKSVHSAAKGFGKVGKETWKAANLPGLKQAAEEFIKSCADVENIQDVVEAITGQVFAQLMKEITPYMGVFSSAISAGTAGKAVAQDGYNLYKSTEYKTGFLPGDPVAAADAVQEIIKRDLTRHSIDLTRHSAATGTKIAGLFVDLGTATTAALGTANALAELGLELYALGVEIKTMRAGNKRLAQPATLDLTVFQDCPVLGCYFLTCADTSLVANFFVADIGLPGWMDRVEEMKKTKMDPLLKIAAKDIQNSRLQLEGLTANKGTHMEKGFFAKKKSKFVNWRLRKQLNLGDKIEGFGSA